MSKEPFHNFSTKIITATQSISNKHVSIVRHVKWMDSVLTFIVDDTYSSGSVKIIRSSLSSLMESELIGNVKLVTDEDCEGNGKATIGWLEVAAFQKSASIYFMTVIKKIKGDNVEYVERIFKVQNVLSGDSLILEKLFHSTELTVRKDCSLVADEERECVYLIGGLNLKRDGDMYRTDISKFNLKTLEWSIVTECYSIHYSHSSLLWKSKFIVIFGGYISSCSSCSNIYLFNLETKQWMTALNILENSSLKSRLNGRTNSGIALIPNEWASKFNRSIPNNSECDTLIIYGGRISKIVSKRPVFTESNEVLLFHLNEQELSLPQRQDYCLRYPFDITKYGNVSFPKNEHCSIIVVGEDLTKMSLLMCGFSDISKVDLFPSINSPKKSSKNKN